MDLDIILPECSFPIQPKGPKYQQKSKLRVTVQDVEPRPTEKHALYFDPVTTQVTFTDEVVAQRPTPSASGALQVRSEGIGGLSNHLATINKSLFFLTNAALTLPDQYLLGPTTFLLHGPEGTGKTLLLDRIAECPWQEVFRVNSGTHPKGQAKAIIETVEAALESQPSLILMDNLDKFTEKAETLVATLRTELAKLEGSQVVVAAAARSIYDVDASLRTTSAFKTELELFPPNVEQREDILQQVLGLTRKLPELDFPAIAERSHGFVGRDIHKLCGLARNRRVAEVYASLGNDKTATFHELLEQSSFVTQEDFDVVIDQVQPTVLKDSILEVPKVRWTDIAGLDHVRALLEAITIRPFKVRYTLLRAYKPILTVTVP